MNKGVYLSNHELLEALELYFNGLTKKRADTENVMIWEAANRITSEAVYAQISSPHYNSSAMDGIATLSTKTHGASEKKHITLEENVDYIVVDTGDPIPSRYDCVIMVEDLIKLDDKRVNIYKSSSAYENIRPIGEDVVEGQLILPSNHRIRPVDIGAVMAGGITSLKVYKKPKVGVIPTGTELVEPGSKLKVGDIVDFNSRVFTAQVEEWGGAAVRYPIVNDDYDAIKAVIIKALKECDMVIVNAGSSAGREDYTCSIIEELGRVIVHGISIKPGKPVILGEVMDKPLIGIPGYPVSAYIIMENIVKKLLFSYQGIEVKGEKKIKATITRRIMSSLKYLEFVRVKIGYVGGRYIATALGRGAGATMSLVQADGILEVPQNVEGIEAGTEVEIKLLRDEGEIKDTLVSIGSHDPIIDIISNLLKERNSEITLSSAHTGSMGGIMALKNGEAHMAPMHLLDVESGEYNISYIKRYLPNSRIVLIKVVNRVQGLLVRKNNPLELKALKSIALKKARFVNRQRGSGTRLFLDYKLRELNIYPEDINGYEREEFTHLGVASAIAAGDADVGLGVYSAAMIMNLDFIPLGNEEYDFAVLEENLNHKGIQLLLDIITGDSFKRELDRLGGYNYSQIGKLVWI